MDGVDPNKLCASQGGPGGWRFQQRKMRLRPLVASRNETAQAAPPSPPLSLPFPQGRNPLFMPCPLEPLPGFSRSFWALPTTVFVILTHAVPSCSGCFCPRSPLPLALAPLQPPLWSQFHFLTHLSTLETQRRTSEAQRRTFPFRQGFPRCCMPCPAQSSAAFPSRVPAGAWKPCPPAHALVPPQDLLLWPPSLPPFPGHPRLNSL